MSNPTSALHTVDLLIDCATLQMANINGCRVTAAVRGMLPCMCEAFVSVSSFGRLDADTGLHAAFVARHHAARPLQHTPGLASPAGAENSYPGFMPCTCAALVRTKILWI